MKNLLLLLVLSMLIFSCQSGKDGYSEHSTGLAYKFIESNTKGKSPEVGDIVVLSIKYFTEDNQLVDESNLYRLQVDRSTYEGDFNTALLMLQVGDSVHLKLDAGNFYERQKKTDLPEEFKIGDPIFIHLRLKNILTVTSLENERRSYYHTDEEQEKKLLTEYIERMAEETAPRPDGMYVIEKSAGTGQEAKNGSFMKIHYTGKTLDGKIFDSSLNRGKPLEMTLGRGEVIKGWDLGLLGQKEGTKLRLIIPSWLAYGKQGYGSQILPYSTLVFEIEIIEIK